MSNLGHPVTVWELILVLALWDILTALVPRWTARAERYVDKEKSR